MAKLSNAPIQYQRGWTEFYKLKFKLTQDVLIPRPETELIVDEVRKIASTQPTGNQITVVDVGTGSGCIAISIAKNISNARIFAIDVSASALEVAKLNARFHKVEKQILFLEHDLLPDIKKAPDIIVANLPYIPTSRLMFIDPMVKDFEPRIALDGGYDGFEIYRKLLSKIKNMGVFPRFIFCEIDDEQGELALSEAKRYFPNADAMIKKDLAKKDRILIIAQGTAPK